ncbi:hypothetical protein [Candidatus Uabimicrobium amorphum]|uniref:Uncharacterized protein n=1 Tax=Uabimicrobium amorphum TaxID=2596890 RepID=A0A5S9IRH3_UABAM|nr:hypothetical protein [Candidatus Uabimicrobium amorphum]BBM86564.1 hypothetical protein UABAM_04950 [Candidatus Uabimicrobium amorphum]
MQYEKAPINETIWRWGIHQEKLEVLQESSQEALEVIGLHGVTAFAGEIPSDAKVSNARVKDLVALGFPVYITPLDATPEHRTVELPKSITAETVEIWNNVWKRMD